MCALSFAENGATIWNIKLLSLSSITCSCRNLEDVCFTELILKGLDLADVHCLLQHKIHEHNEAKESDGQEGNDAQWWNELAWTKYCDYAPQRKGYE